MTRGLALAAVVLAALCPGPAAAQQIQRIAAIVNDDVISLYDLTARMRLVVISSRLDDSAEIRRRLAPQVLRSLIDERLQLQEAKRRNVSVTKRDMKRAIATIEARNKVPKGGFERFLTKNGIEQQTVLDQLRANIAWSKLVRRQLRPRVTVGEEEVDAAIERIKSNRGKLEFRISEIFLSVDSPDDEPRVRTIADRMVAQIREGARFDALARQFSQSSSAAVRGDLGWMPVVELGDGLREVVPKLRKGEVAAPIRTLTGFRIIMLSDRRKVAAPDDSKITIGLKQIFLPLPSDAAPNEVKSQIDLAKTVGETISGCGDMAAVSKEMGSPRPPDLGKFPLGELSPLIRTAVDGLDVGVASQPVRLPDGLLVLMVCERDVPKIRLPGRDEISDQITQRRLDMMARRYLRDIRRAAIVDVRV